MKTTKAKIGKKFKNSCYSLTFPTPIKKNPLLGALINEDNVTETENQAKTYKSSLNGLVDLFAMGGALRSRPDHEVITLFIKAFTEDQLLATKLLFHLRNVRGGLGERKVFKTIAAWLAQNYPTIFQINLDNIAFFGRMDDLYVAFNTGAQEGMLAWIDSQLDEDVHNYENNKPVSLLAKWLPSENTSSAKTRSLAVKIRTYLKWTPKQYRKTLSELRKYIDIVERKMSANEWEKVNYERVPSKANLNYRDAFRKHDNQRYQDYLDAVKKGEKKMNASALFPYEIVEKAKYGDSDALNALWDALPDYMEDNQRDILTVADMSGSMNMSMKGRPMDMALSLAIYTAEHNKGAFANYFITFSEEPTLQRVVGKTLAEKIRCIQKHAHVNTDLQKVFAMLLQAATNGDIKQADMPKQVLVVTDMEFDKPYDKTKTNVEGIEEMYAQAGYEMPQLVFWNVNSHQNNVPVKADKKGVLLVSGASPSVFKTLLSGKQYTPVDQMLETLNQEMYNRVKINIC